MDPADAAPDADADAQAGAQHPPDDAPQTDAGASRGEAEAPEEARVAHARGSDPSDTPRTTPSPAAPLTERPHPAGEAAALLAVSLLLAAGVNALGAEHPSLRFLRDVHPALYVLAWILPAYVVVSRRGRDPFVAHALLVRPRAVGSAAAVSVGLLVAFVIGFGVWQGGWPSRPVPWGPVVTLFCFHLVFVALPEEYFFRGVLQPAWESPQGPARRLLGAPVGRGWLLGALVFGGCHVLFEPAPERLLVVFPGLWFGWLRARTGSLALGVFFHAGANAVELACVEAWGVGRL